MRSDADPGGLRAPYALTRWGLVALSVLGLAGLAACSQIADIGQASSIAVYVVDGLTRVRPGDPPGRDRTVHIRAARNEYEPFQIVVWGGEEGLKGVNVEVTELKGKDGSAIERRHIALYREHYVRVSAPSPRSKEGPGWYPDALIPFQAISEERPLSGARFTGAPFNVPAHRNQPVWVDVFVPRETPGGSFTGTVIVRAEQHDQVNIPLLLTVWDFSLPDAPSLRSHFGSFGRRVARRHHLRPDSAEFRAVEHRYAEEMAQHRLSPPVPASLRPQIALDGSIDSTGSHEALKGWMQRFHVNRFPITLVGEDPVGRDRARNLRYLRSMHAYLEENHWSKFAYVYVLDEPNTREAYEEVRKRAKLIREAHPALKVLCTVQPTPRDPSWGTLVGAVDIWVPLWSRFEKGSVDHRLQAGDEVWSYTALAQGDGLTPSWLLDFPLLNYRIPMWLSWRYGLSGLLYWSAVNWDRAGDVWSNPLTYAEYNGEGLLLYPGVDAGIGGPVPSMRLKTIREGMEDYEYLRIFSAITHRDRADGIAREVAVSWTKWNENGSGLYSIRERIARSIERALRGSEAN